MARAGPGPRGDTGRVKSQETHNEVLVAADIAAHAEDWQALWELRDRLRATDLWVGSYGAACAIAGWHVDREAGRAVLDEVIAAGFHQPEMFSDEFADTFATEDGWAERERQMLAQVPPPRVELLNWPDYAPTIEPVLDRLPAERERLLGEMLPAGTHSAWETARNTLDWVTARWEHANGHVDNRDALEVLERVDAGERFACVEYTIVLSQALNALGIPARSLNLLMRDHHTGAGRGHVVSEAWIDDLARWVLLDGQNGAWWGEENAPLGVLELMARYRDDDRPAMNSRVRDLSDQEQAVWFWYFANARTTGLGWSDGPFVPTFQNDYTVRTERLVRGSEHVAPDLSRIGTAVVDRGGPALEFTPVHPFAIGVDVRRLHTDDDDDLVHLTPGDALRLDLPPGLHAFDVATVTGYGTLHPTLLRYETH